MLLAFLYFWKLYCTAINMIGIFVVLCFLHFLQYIWIFEREKSWKLLPCIWQDLYLTAFQGRRRWRMEEIWIARCTNCKRQKWNLAMQKSLAEICTNPCEILKKYLLLIKMIMLFYIYICSLSSYHHKDHRHKQDHHRHNLFTR